MENPQLNSYLKEHLAPIQPGDTPDRLLVFEARQMVMNRGRIHHQGNRVIDWLLAFLGAEVRMYHLGLSMIFIFAVFIYCRQLNEANIRGTAFSSCSEDAFALSGHTVSVTSSTMLTSIPTLVIRN